MIETAFAAALVGISFVALFSINSQCLYYVNCSRELLTASNVLQARMEQLRNCHWSQVTASDGSYIKGANVLGTAAPGVAALGSVTEVIKVDSYPSPQSGSPGALTITRLPNGTLTGPTTNAAIASGDMAAITISISWTTAPGSRSRSVSLSTVWAEKTR